MGESASYYVTGQNTVLNLYVAEAETREHLVIFSF